VREELLSGLETFQCVGHGRRRSSVGALLAAVLALLSVGGCGKGDGKAAEGASRPIEVTAVTVTPQDAPVSFEFVAQTQSSRQVNIQARVSGFLEKRMYTEGGMVKEGQVLFTMDTRPFETQVAAQAAALAKQQAALEVARANYERTKPLTAQNALSQKDLDDATGQFHVAEAEVEAAKARLESANLDLSYCTIASPVAGITGAAQQQDGAYISPSNSLLTTVAALSPMWVNFSLSENQWQDYVSVRARGEMRAPKDGEYVVEVLLADGSLYPHTGRITFAAPSYNAETGTFLLRASVDNPDGVLRPNMFVRVRVKGAMLPQAIQVPQRAVQQGAEGHFVWVVGQGDTAERRPVVIGKWQGSNWFISEGLHAGNQVIVDGVLTLRVGVPVVVKAVTLDAASADKTGSAQ
jgi:membrane fusion protein (multidrug efflux system)